MIREEAKQTNASISFVFKLEICECNGTWRRGELAGGVGVQYRAWSTMDGLLHFSHLNLVSCVHSRGKRAWDAWRCNAARELLLLLPA